MVQWDKKARLQHVANAVSSHMPLDFQSMLNYCTEVNVPGRRV